MTSNYSLIFRGSVDPDPALARLYDEIRQTIVVEWEVIHQVFPNPNTVLQVFTQRIFAQSVCITSWQVQNFIEGRLELARNKSLGYYLEVLAISHSITAELVDDLHEFDEKTIAEAMGSCALTTVLDRSLVDLFVPYIDSNRYIDLETEWLIATLNDELEPFQTDAVLHAHSRRNEVKARREELVLHRHLLPKKALVQLKSWVPSSRVSTKWVQIYLQVHHLLQLQR